MFQVQEKWNIKLECPDLKKGNKGNKEGSSRPTNLVKQGEPSKDDDDMLSVISGLNH